MLRLINSFYMRSKFFLIAIFVDLAIIGQTQSDSLHKVKYTPEYKFTEGIYPNFESLKKAAPIPKGRIISDYDYNDNNFYDDVLSQKKVYYYDNLGNRLEIQTSKIWGYSKNGLLYINVNDGFYRITLIGSICHFIAYQTYSNYGSSPYYNSYYSTYPYYHS